MNLANIEIWYSGPMENGSNPLRSSRVTIIDTETGRPFLTATRCVVEITVEGLEIVGIEVLDLDENGQQRRENRKGKVIAYGTLPDKQLMVERAELRRAGRLRGNSEYLDSLPENERADWKLDEETGHLLKVSEQQAVEA